MENQYAQALWQMVEDGMEPKKAVDAVHASLKVRGREALMPRVGKAFERLAARELGKHTLTLTVAREKDANAAKAEIKDALARLNAKVHEVVVREDDSLIGGWRLEGREILLDASFKKQLLDIYNGATA